MKVQEFEITIYEGTHNNEEKGYAVLLRQSDPGAQRREEPIATHKGTDPEKLGEKTAGSITIHSDFYITYNDPELETPVMLGGFIANASASPEAMILFRAGLTKGLKVR